MEFEAQFETDDAFSVSFGESGGGGGSDVRIVPALSEGVKIADYFIDGNIGALYAPDNGPQLAALDETLQKVIDKIGGLDEEYRFFRFLVLRAARVNTVSDYANAAELKILDADGTDISRLPGAIYTASSYYSGDDSHNPPQYAFDGQAVTYWETDWKNAKSYVNWIGVELPEPHKPVGVSILPRPVDGNKKDHWTDFQFQVSVDGERWLTIFTATGLSDGWDYGEFRDFTW